MSSGTCEVCASEPSKYRCPTCRLMSCSLACTQSHKIYCAPKPQSPKPSNVEDANQPPHHDINGHAVDEGTHVKQNTFNLEALASSPQIKDLLNQNPQLCEQLRDIYRTTLEEEWVEQEYGGRQRHYQRGKGAHRNRGPWTREKGFKRGLGKVRKLRERIDEGLEKGKHAEGFVRLMTLVNGASQPEEAG